MERQEFFTESNSIIVRDSIFEKQFTIYLDNSKRALKLNFDNEDKPSLIKFLESVIEELKK